MSKSILTETTQAINTQVDFRAVLAQIEAEDTFAAAYAAAVRAALLDLSPGQGGLQSGDELAHELFGE